MIGKDKNLKAFTLAELLIAASIFVLAFFLASSIIGMINKQEAKLRAIQKLDIDSSNLMLKITQIIRESKIESVGRFNIKLLDKNGEEVEIKIGGENIFLVQNGHEYQLNSDAIRITDSFFYIYPLINGKNANNKSLIVLLKTQPSSGIFKDKISTVIQTSITSRRYAY